MDLARDKSPRSWNGSDPGGAQWTTGVSDVGQLLDAPAVGAERRERLDDLVRRDIGEPDPRHHARRVEALARTAAITWRDRPVLALPQIVIGDVERVRQAVDRDQLQPIALLHGGQGVRLVEELADIDVATRLVVGADLAGRRAIDLLDPDPAQLGA